MSEFSAHTGNMFDVIAASLFQKKQCLLPGIGKLEVVTEPASYDFASQQIYAPQQKVVFTPSNGKAQPFNEFSAISQLLKETLQQQPLVNITGLGRFSNNNGTICFVASSLPEDYFQPVRAEKVIHKDAAHSILVGDKETTSVEMKEYYSEEETTKSKWWILPLILAILAAGLLAWHISKYGFNYFSSQSLF